MKQTKRNIDPNKPKVRLPSGKNYINVKNIVEDHRLNTICSSGKCPNISDCWGKGTATFMILGDICTRSCKFCSVKTGKPLPVDMNEPKRIANSVKLMELKHCVLTSVDRDDLEDGGSIIWADTVKEIKKASPKTTIETLIPDFQGITKNIDRIIQVHPEIVSHNLETVERLTKQVRVQAKYETSLFVLKYLKEAGIKTKSGIMLGLGELEDEVYKTMEDLLHVGCKILTIGQYLQPTKKQFEVSRFISEEEFNQYKQKGLKMGFKIVESNSLVRSSYNADQHLLLI